MILKSHLCGIAVAYNGEEDKREPKGNFFNRPDDNFFGRPQGSLYSQQKLKIANACEWLRLNATYKPIIFVATSPGFTNHANENSLIKKFTHNLRNGYACKNYVWVREFTKAGYPHFHFVADLPDFNPIELSTYWSGLFDSNAVNSIRLGTAPKCSQCKTKLKHKGQPCYKPGCNGVGVVGYYLKGKKMSWYLTKYLGKGIGSCEKTPIGKRSFRTFAVSTSLSKSSEPELFYSLDRVTEKKKNHVVVSHTKIREWVNADKEVIIQDKEVLNRWNWNYTGFANTFKGYPKEWKLNKK